MGNLLHVSIGQLHDPSSPGSAGGLNGTRNSTSNGGFKGDADHTVPVTATSDNFSFTSDFLDFGTQDRSALSWALGTLVPCLTRNAAATAACTSAAAATGNFLHSVKLSGVVGNFGSNPEPRSIFTNPVPEPSGISLGLLGSLLVGVSLMAGKRRSVVGSR